jgi:hypothetical protein
MHTKSLWERAKPTIDVLSGVSVIATMIFIAYQSYEMKEGGEDTHDLAVAAGKQADAAGKQAANTHGLAVSAGKEADNTRTIAESTKSQADQAIKEVHAVAELAQQTKRSADEAGQSAQISEKSLAVSTEAMQLDQRAWVGVDTVTARVVGSGTQGLFNPIVEVVLRNSGKTPAIKLGGQTFMINELSAAAPIPDYDSEIEARAKLVEKFRQQMLERTPAQLRTFITSEIQRLEPQFVIPEGDVLAPQGTRPVVLMGGGFRDPASIRDPATNAPMPAVDYGLAKFTYYDIFQRKIRTTKICVRWRGGNTLPEICPEGNWMD